MHAQGILTWAVHVINLWVSVTGYMYAGWLQFYFKAPNQSHAVHQTFAVRHPNPQNRFIFLNHNYQRSSEHEEINIYTYLDK